jgi:hypothetical protein
VTARGAETRFTGVAVGVVGMVEEVVVVVGEVGAAVLVDRVGAETASGVDGAEGGGEAEALSSAS